MIPNMKNMEMKNMKELVDFHICIETAKTKTRQNKAKNKLPMFFDDIVSSCCINI